MNERYELDGEKVRLWLAKEDRKQTYLIKQLGISGSLLDKMLCNGHVPKERTLQALADLMGITSIELLIPKKAAKTA
jgi:transcriptional regulator with XRE-family HTH domain